MADVILFRPRMTKREANILCSRPPLALLHVAAPLVKNNYKVKIIDEEADSRWPEELQKELDNSTICVGVSSMTGRQILGGLKFSKSVKERFNIPVIWGGVHASMLAEQTIKNDLVDIVVTGEGEEALLKIVNALKRGNDLKNIPNIWWKENDRIHSNPKGQFIDLSNLPLPPYHLLDCERYINMERSYLPGCKRIFDLHTDRGCPFRCSFCYNLKMNRRKWRAVSASNVVEQIEYLVEKLSVDGIDFISDNFFVDKERTIDICKGIIKKNLKIDWHTNCRINYLAKYDNSFLGLLKESGCKTLSYGVESGSPKMLNLLDKDITPEEVYMANKKMKKWKIAANYAFMVGFPDETKDDVVKTYRMMMKLCREYPGITLFGPFIYTPYPGTQEYDKCLKMGFKPPEKLVDWSDYEWTEDKTHLPFINPSLSKWLSKSISITRRIAKGGRWKEKWFRFRTKVIIKFRIIGPQPEIYLSRFIKGLIRLIYG